MPLCCSIYKPSSSLLFGQVSWGSSSIQFSESVSPPHPGWYKTHPHVPSQLFPEPRDLPALGAGRQCQITSSAANQHLNGAHEMQMRMPRGRQGTHHPLHQHAQMLSVYAVYFSHGTKGEPLPGGMLIPEGAALLSWGAGVLCSTVLSPSSIGSSCSPGSLGRSQRSVRFSATQRVPSSCR